MKTQISRRSYDARKRYSAVYQQQGRMITDADWNELSEIAKRRLDRSLDDAVADGAPKQGGAGLVQAGPGQPVEVRAGRLYADGVGADAVAASDPEAATFALDDQADFPEAPALPGGNSIVYADVWERTVTSLEDPDQLRDPALHGADTCSRSQTMAQIKWCRPTFDPEDEAVNAPRGNAALSAELRSNIEIEDPCDPCAVEVASEGTVGNYLFRLEVHDVQGPAAAPDRVVLKWSRENGAEQHQVGTEPPGFAADNWQYEFFDDITEKNLGVHLAAGFTPSRGTLEEGFPASTGSLRQRVRRWDGFCTLQRDGGNSWSLVGGRDRGVTLPQPGDAANPPHGFVQVSDRLVVHLERVRLELTLEDRLFVAGDYWLAPVREAVAGNGGTLLDAAPPVGIEHHYLRLGSVAGGTLQDLDTERLRQLNFPPLTAIEAGDVGYETACTGEDDNGIFDDSHDTVEKALNRLCALDAGDVAFSSEPGCDALASATTVEEALDALCANASLELVSGDGQEAPVGEFLPGPLEVRVAVGQFPVAGRQIEFSIDRDDGGGTLRNAANNQSGRTLTVTTDGRGVAEVRWRLGADAPGTASPPASPGQRVVARLADRPTIFVGFNAATRGEAVLDPRVRIEGIEFADGTALENEMTVPVSQFARGLQLVADEEIDPAVFAMTASEVASPARPNLELSVYLPYPLDDSWGLARREPVGFQPLVLAGEASVSGQLLRWRPLDGTNEFLLQSLFQRLSEIRMADRLLVFIRLRGGFVWSESNQRTFVDGDTFGSPEDGQRMGVRLPSGDRIAGGDLEAWFWIEPDQQRPSLEFDRLRVEGSTIFGRLVSEGSALPGLRVDLLLGTSRQVRSATTDARGQFVFPNVPNGTHSLRARVGRETATARVRVGRVIGSLGSEILVTDTLVFDNREVERRPLREVDDVGNAFATNLEGAGIRDATELAMANPHEVSGALNVPLERARRIIRNARVTTFRGGNQ